MPRPRRKNNPNAATALATIAAKGVDAAVAPFGSRAALYTALVAHTDAAIAAQPLPFDNHDSTRDKIFALLMQRVDALHEHRAAYLRVIEALMRHPADARALAAPLQRSLKNLLRTADAGDSALHVAALGIAYIAIIAAWRNDTSADLGRTMKACDKALGILENLASFV